MTSNKRTRKSLSEKIPGEGDVAALRRIASDVKLGRNVKLHDFVNLYGCEIADNTKIGTFVEIQKEAKVGKNCKIQSHTFICEGVIIKSTRISL
jgi:UDP-3-O-[3-hydroxymyristoyl] glucosamine N-acyltransferase